MATPPASERTVEAVQPPSEPRPEHLETGAVNGQPRTADTQPPRADASSVEHHHQPDAEKSLLAAPHPSGAAPGSDPASTARRDPQPDPGGAQVLDRAAAPGAAVSGEARRALAPQAGSATVPGTGTPAPILGRPSIARPADVPSPSAAAGPGRDVSGTSIGLFVAEGAAAPAGGSGQGAVALPLFNPFLTRRPRRRSIGLPEGTGGVWAILRVLGWRRWRGRGRAVPDLPEREEAATLRAWCAALARRTGA